MTRYDCQVPRHDQATSVRAPTPEEAAKEAVRRLVKSVPPHQWTVDAGGHRLAVRAMKKVRAGSGLPPWDEFELTAESLED
jgi:hypothetical protein